MSPKQYTALERFIKAMLVTLVLTGVATALLGVYALADLVL